MKRPPRKAVMRRLSLRAQLILTTSLVSIVASLIVGVSSYVQQSTALRRQAAEMIAYRTGQAALNIRHLTDSVRENLMMLASDSRVQAYLQVQDETTPEAVALLDEVFTLLSYSNSLQYNLAYSYIIKEDTDRVIYLGPSRAQRDLDFAAAFAAVEDTGDSGYGPMAGPILNPVSYDDHSYVFLLYQAIFDMYQLQNRLGVLCLALPEHSISSEFASTEEDALDLFLVDAQGRILSHIDPERILTMLPAFAKMQEDEQVVDDMLLVRRAVPNTPWYVVGTIPERAIIADRSGMMLLVIGMVLLTILLCTIVSALLVKRFTKPFEALRTRMEEVSGGNFGRSIDLSAYGAEYGLISQGFNTMSERIAALVQEASEASSALKESELRALKAQINPHFLYNTLDSIHWLAAIHGEKEISTMVMALAGFYRVCLGSARERIPLSEEIQHATSYLTIQRMRYSDILQSEMHVDDRDLALLVPSMILQPLIENSIYHGLKGRDQPGMVRIRIYREGGALVMDVTDDGRGMEESEIRALNASLQDPGAEIKSHGVMNVHRRIQLLCGEAYGLTYARQETGGLVVRIQLPIIEGEEDDVHSPDRG